MNKSAIKWSVVWDKFEKIVNDPTFMKMEYFQDWPGKVGQAILLRNILQMQGREWNKFNRKYLRWWRRGQDLPCPPSWEAQKAWIQEYFDNL